MSRTHKDARSKMGVKRLHVRKNDAGTYEVFLDDDLLCSGLQEQFLKEELCVRYGFCGEEYEAILSQLNAFGEATVVF